MRLAIAGALDGAIAAQLPGRVLPPAQLERARHQHLGDFASGIALQLARHAAMPSLALAEALAARLPIEGPLAEVTVAAPGFLNFRISDDWLAAELGRILAASPPAAPLPWEPGQDLREARARLMNAPAAREVSIRPPGESLDNETMRYWLQRFPADQPIVLDAAIARSENAENPAYYVRYTHARIQAIARLALAEGLASGLERPACLAPTARELLLLVAAYPDEQALVKLLRAPERMPRYAEALARAFHSFYAACRVIGDPAGAFHLALVQATGRVLGSVLQEGLGVAAPMSLECILVSEPAKYVENESFLPPN
jgi:arginyl-tRNA synthetase